MANSSSQTISTQMKARCHRAMVFRPYFMYVYNSWPNIENKTGSAAITPKLHCTACITSRRSSAIHILETPHPGQ